MEQVEYLLSNKWDNAFLNEIFIESLIYLRNDKGQNASEKDLDKSNFFRETPIFLVDHPKLNLYNSDALVVGKDNPNDKTMVFIFKDGLTKELNNLYIHDTKDVEAQIIKYIEKVGLNVMKENNEKHVVISKNIFIELLKNANLNNTIENLNLQKNLDKKFKLKS